MKVQPERQIIGDAFPFVACVKHQKADEGWNFEGNNKNLEEMFVLELIRPHKPHNTYKCLHARLPASRQDHRLEVRIPDELARYCIDKGSITIDGISLTIANLNGSLLEFWITPHTFGRTNLQRAVPGQPVNLEVDMLAKYVEKLFASRGNTRISF